MDINIVKPGDRYADHIDVIKVKNGKPTVIKVDGLCYRFDVEATEKENRAQELSIIQKRHRLRNMGRIT